MKIEKEVIYNLVTSEGTRIEISETELIDLYDQLHTLNLPPKKLPEVQMIKITKNNFYQGEY